jgi:hypothetical protein
VPSNGATVVDVAPVPEGEPSAIFITASDIGSSTSDSDDSNDSTDNSDSDDNGNMVCMAPTTVFDLFIISYGQAGASFVSCRNASFLKRSLLTKHLCQLWFFVFFEHELE